MSQETSNSYTNISTVRTVAALMAISGSSDAAGYDHARRVSHFAELIGYRLAIAEQDMQNLVKAAMLHDIGKVALSETILKKIGRLTSQDIEIMQIHSSVILGMLEKVDGLQGIIPLIKHQSEWFDGTGRPDGISATQIPLGARIIAAAEAFDILIKGTPWKPRCSLEQALEEIQRFSGSQFDPSVVSALYRIIMGRYSAV